MALRRYKRDRLGRFAKGSGGGPGRGNKGSNPKKGGNSKRKSRPIRRRDAFTPQGQVRMIRAARANKRKNAVVVNRPNKNQGSLGGEPVKKRMSQERKDQIKAGVALTALVGSYALAEYNDPSNRSKRESNRLYRAAKKRDNAKFGPQKGRQRVNTAAMMGYRVAAARRNRKRANVVFPGGLGTAMR